MDPCSEPTGLREAPTSSSNLKLLVVVLAYTKKALAAHAQTNCLSEILVKSAQGWANSSKFSAENLKEKRNLESLPLAGGPVSLKDTVGVEGRPLRQNHNPDHESTSDVFGVTTNPYNKGYSPDGSSGGEAALLAYGGSRVGVGTDVAGSVRVPAHYCGVYSIRSSAQRFLKAGNATSIPGQEGVLPVYSPMARTLEDLDTFWQAVMSMKPLKYDPSVLPIPWRKLDFEGRTALKWAVIWDDGESAQQFSKYNVLTLPPRNDPALFGTGLNLAAQLLLADGGKVATKPVRFGEFNDPGMVQAMRMISLPRPQDPLLLGGDGGWDFILTVPNALPAVPHGGMKDGWKSCGYTFLWNLLDYSAGVMPITHVNSVLDRLAPRFAPRNAIEKGAYDPVSMSGLPVGVQVISRRLEELKVMEGMKIIEGLLTKEGIQYEGIKI
ncbi:hypothetical protein PLEOSDRAFT_1094031 [Pleurotus ostreatus PC15]|uniref:Amidase domain-containing protein n=1 Tax=Pleurotus ostreatus (strain PC15) TaxID=1137138 RepID=A0A067NBV9_PLEO1|nr:hypothetical protein PLEOSDRAFT_1094031 [Pleurotus ostreatus PC15]